MSGTPWQDTAGRRANGEEILRAAHLECKTEPARRLQIPLVVDLAVAMAIVSNRPAWGKPPSSCAWGMIRVTTRRQRRNRRRISSSPTCPSGVRSKIQ